MNAPLLILGVADPEMNEIERLAREVELRIYQACKNNHPVNRSNAYEANKFRQISGTPSRLGNFLHNRRRTLLFIECQSPGLEKKLETQRDNKGAASIRKIDHHNPGDHGYQHPSSHFLSGSSLGQFLKTMICEWGYDFKGIRWRTDSRRRSDGFFYNRGRWWIHSNGRSGCIPTRMVLIAAGDHCLPQAYRGRCPGVDPDHLMRFRITLRGLKHNRNPKEIESQISYTRMLLRKISVNGVADLTNTPSGSLPEAPEAATREGITALCRVRNKPDGRDKLLVIGSEYPEQIKRWMAAQEAYAQRVYGSPARGYAGAIFDTYGGNIPYKGLDELYGVGSSMGFEMRVCC